MDPYVLTIVKQSLVLGAAIGIMAALIYGMVQYSKLRYAVSLNMITSQLP